MKGFVEKVQKIDKVRRKPDWLNTPYQPDKPIVFPCDLESLDEISDLEGPSEQAHEE
jgi:hypothetical protein